MTSFLKTTIQGYMQRRKTVGNEQKIFLLHPMKILHTKYQSESNIPVSYTFFCKNRPTNVVPSRLKNNRDVSACDNGFIYEIEELHRERVITAPDTEEEFQEF